MSEASLPILVVSQKFPYPPHDGGKVDILYRLEALKSLGYRTHLIVYYNPAEPSPMLAPLEKLCEKVFAIPILRHKLSKVLQLKPYYMASTENKAEIEKILPELVKYQYQFIIAETHHILTVALDLRKRLSIRKFIFRSQADEPKFLMSNAKTSSFFSIKKPLLTIRLIAISAVLTQEILLPLRSWLKIRAPVYREHLISS